ncbi:MAG: energy transducer TonB [Thalassotalea sp.]
MKKLIPITFLAALTTLSLFAFMAYLISSDKTAPIEVNDYPLVEVYQRPDESKVVERVKPDLTPPPAPAPAPKTPITPVDVNEVSVVDVTIPPIDLDSGGVDTLIQGPPDNEARPVVRINPKYPIVAANNGIEGWVVLSFNINKIGQVIDVEVIDAEPKRIFDKEAKRALKKWKYHAKVENGKPVVQENLTVRLDFNINQQS